ncbi:MAG: sugar ABC transporter permease [Chloroflexi bacterium]|nr:sugar ABC transporter permease [Chloroflexota bacterium]
MATIARSRAEASAPVSVAMRRRNTRVGVLFALPFLIGFLTLQVYPLIASFYYSFTQFNVFQSPIWIGGQNYAQLIHDPLFWTSLQDTFFMVVIGIPIQLVLAFLVALLLNSKVKGIAVFRTFVYLPTVTPIVASSLLWLWLLNPVYGPINFVWVHLLHTQGPGWFATAAWAKPAMIVMGLWGIGTAMIVFLAALQGVPEQLYEAARIDGANGWQRALRVTLPLISPATFFLLITHVIDTLQIFASAYIVASGGGGPQNALLFYAVYLYQNAFNYLKMGYASAMAWLLFIVIVFLTLLIFRSGRRWVYYEG